MQLSGHRLRFLLARISVLSAQRRTATKRRSGTRRSDVPAAPAVETTDDAVEATEDAATEQPVRRAGVVKPPTAQERSQARAESKAAARKNSEQSERTGGIASRVISTERTSGVRKFVRETMAEIKKVNWPDRETTRNLTLVVVAVSVALGLILGGLDYVLFQIFEALP
jgi:preprotein translocase subunit SecE